MHPIIKLSSPATREFWKIPVVFEDEYLMAVDKPGGLLTSPDRDDPRRPNLMKLLRAGISTGKPWARERGLEYLMNAHRLDFETSGVLLLARCKPVLVQLANLFGSEKPVRSYLALVRGLPVSNAFEVDAPLGPHPSRAGLMRVDRMGGRKSKTRVEVLERFSRGGYALLKCAPLPGRTHQIRVHLQHAGLPIVGDGPYGGKPLWLSHIKSRYRLKPGRAERPLIGRVTLHADRLELPHPATHARITITAPWPKDLTVAVRYLRKYAA